MSIGTEVSTDGQDLRIDKAKMNQSLASLGETLVSLGTLLQQGWRTDNEDLRGQIAAGLERTAAYMRGEHFNPQPDPKHLLNKGT